MAWYHNATKLKAKKGDLVTRVADGAQFTIEHFPAECSLKNGAALYCSDYDRQLPPMLFMPSDVGLFHSTSEKEHFDEPETEI